MKVIRANAIKNGVIGWSVPCALQLTVIICWKELC